MQRFKLSLASFETMIILGSNVPILEKALKGKRDAVRLSFLICQLPHIMKKKSTIDSGEVTSLTKFPMAISDGKTLQHNSQVAYPWTRPMLWINPTKALFNFLADQSQEYVVICRNFHQFSLFCFSSKNHIWVSPILLSGRLKATSQLD